VRVILAALISAVAQDSFDFVFFLELDVVICDVARLGSLVVIKFLKVLNIVHIVGYFATAAGDPDFLCGLPIFLLALGRASTIIRVRI
jgi:hypothetical protein